MNTTNNPIILAAQRDADQRIAEREREKQSQPRYILKKMRSLWTCWDTQRDDLTIAGENKSIIEDSVRESNERHAREEVERVKREIAERKARAVDAVEQYRLVIKPADNNRWIVDTSRSGLTVQHEERLNHAYCNGVINPRDSWIEAVEDAAKILEAEKASAK